MKSVKVNPETTGWTTFPGDTATIIAHFKGGHKERFTLVEFLVAKKAHKHVVQLDCYKEGEEIKEDVL